MSVGCTGNGKRGAVKAVTGVVPQSGALAWGIGFGSTEGQICYLLCSLLRFLAGVTSWLTRACLLELGAVMKWIVTSLEREEDMMGQNSTFSIVRTTETVP